LEEKILVAIESTGVQNRVKWPGNRLLYVLTKCD
jgi:hypothetical protein